MILKAAPSLNFFFTGSNFGNRSVTKPAHLETSSKAESYKVFIAIKMINACIKEVFKLKDGFV